MYLLWRAGKTRYRDRRGGEKQRIEEGINQSNGLSSDASGARADISRASRDELS